MDSEVDVDKHKSKDVIFNISSLLSCLVHDLVFFHESLQGESPQALCPSQMLFSVHMLPGKFQLLLRYLPYVKVQLRCSSETCLLHVSMPLTQHVQDRLSSIKWLCFMLTGPSTKEIIYFFLPLILHI